MVSLIIRILDIFRKLFVALGVDHEQLRSIVEVKLTMDNRRHIVAFGRRKQKEAKNTFLSTFLIYLFLSLFMGLIFLYYNSFTLAGLIFFTYIMMMIVMTLVTDFSSVLLDTSDNTIVLARPVSNRTVFVARLVHILVYLVQITVALSLLPLIVIAMTYPAVFTVFFSLGIFLSVLISLLLTIGLYFLVIQFTSEEKLKNIINYLQIAMTILMVGGYQLGPRLMARMEYQSFEIAWWSIFIPPIWITGALEAIRIDSWNNLDVALATLSFLFPFSGLYFMYKYMIPGFNKKLYLLDRVNDRKKLHQSKRRTSLQKLINLIAKPGIEQGAFELVYHIIGRDRKIKLKIYPSFGYVFVFAIVFLLSGERDANSTLHELHQSSYFILMIYLAFMILQVAIREIAYSDEFKASWIFFSAPITAPGEILTGTIKALIVRLFIPAYLLLSTIVIAFWGITAIDDLIFGFLNNCLMLGMLLAINPHRLPLSMAPNIRAQSGSFGRSILSLLLVGGLGIVHYALSPWPIIIWGCIPFQLLALYLLHRAYQSISWPEIQV